MNDAWAGGGAPPSHDPAGRLAAGRNVLKGKLFLDTRPGVWH
jgi:hypothetical protein